MSKLKKKSVSVIVPITLFNRDECDKENSYNIEYPMRPISLPLYIFAMSRFLTSKPKKLFHGVLAINAIIVAGALSVLGRSYTTYTALSFSFIVIDIINLLTLISTVVGNILVSCFQPNSTYRLFLKRQACIDRLLGIEADAKYKNEKTIAIKLIFITTVPILIITAANMYQIAAYFGSDILVTYLINYFVYFLNSLVTAQFVLSMYFLRSLLYSLKVQLEIYDKVRHGDMLPLSTGFDVKTSWLTKYLRETDVIFHWRKVARSSRDAVFAKGFSLENKMNAYIKICEQAEFINTFFGLQNLLMVINDMVSIIRSLQIASSSSFGTEDQFSFKVIAISLTIVSMGLAVYDIVIIFYTTALCVLLTKEAKQISSIVDTFLYKKPANEFQGDRLELWSHLVARKNPCFTAMGFFPMDFTLVYSMAGAISTYLIILMQLK